MKSLSISLSLSSIFLCMDVHKVTDLEKFPVRISKMKFLVCMDVHRVTDLEKFPVRISNEPSLSGGQLNLRKFCSHPWLRTPGRTSSALLTIDRLLKVSYDAEDVVHLDSSLVTLQSTGVRVGHVNVDQVCQVQSCSTRFTRPFLSYVHFYT